jgi:glycosyltransferase involved in cell wall biosynthesis
MSFNKKLYIISQSDGAGGAARAALRTYLCLKRQNKYINFIVGRKTSSDSGVIEISRYQRILCAGYSRFDRLICDFLEPYNKEWKTISVIGVLKAKKLNKLDCEILNFHWMGHGLISLRQISKIKKPIVWTLHDEWLLHDISHSPSILVRDKTRNFVIEQFVKIIKHKIRYLKDKIVLKDNIYLVGVGSALSRDLEAKYPSKKAKIFTIANPVDTDLFYPDYSSIVINGEKVLPPSALFLGGTKDFIKGWDLLEQSLEFCASKFTLFVTGGYDFVSGPKKNVRIIGIDKIRNDEQLRKLYTSVDVVVVPSRVEAFGQVASEAISCGTPVVCFKTGGLTDIVIDDVTGTTVEAFNLEDFGNAIDEYISRGKAKFPTSPRNFALTNFSFKAIESKYESIFNQAVSKS